MNKLNKVLLCAGVIAAITSAYAAERQSASAIFSMLPEQQQRDVVSNLTNEVLYQLFKFSSSKLQDKVLEPVRGLLETQLRELLEAKLQHSVNNSQESDITAAIPNQQPVPMSDCAKGLVEALSSWKNPNQLALLKTAISTNDKQAVKRSINEMRIWNNLELQKRLDETFEREVSNNNIEGVQFLVDLGAYVYVDRQKGFKLLHYAAANNSKEIGEILISKGADINAKHGRHAKAPLQFAIEKSSKDMEQLLRSKGAHE